MVAAAALVLLEWLAMKDNHCGDECHGWSAVWCAGCGSVAPCARNDCPSCHDVLQETQARREEMKSFGGSRVFASRPLRLQKRL